MAADFYKVSRLFKKHYNKYFSFAKTECVLNFHDLWWLLYLEEKEYNHIWASPFVSPQLMDPLSYRCLWRILPFHHVHSFWNLPTTFCFVTLVDEQSFYFAIVLSNWLSWPHFLAFPRIVLFNTGSITNTVTSAVRVHWIVTSSTIIHIVFVKSLQIMWLFNVVVVGLLLTFLPSCNLVLQNW